MLKKSGFAVVGTVTTRKGLALVTQRVSLADWLEVRLDALMAAGVELDEVGATLTARKQRILLTLRIPAEGGQRRWSQGERVALFLRFLPVVDAVDVELARAKECRAVLKAARRNGKTIVLSAHALKRVPHRKTLLKWTREFSREKPDIRKIAALVRRPEDIQRLGDLMARHPHERWALMGVGPLAGVSRLELARQGSVLAYGYADSPAAPGQPSIYQLKRKL